MFKKKYGILKTKVVTEYPIKKYYELTEKYTYTETLGSLIFASDSEKEREEAFNKIFTSEHWDDCGRFGPRGGLKSDGKKNEPLPTQKPELPEDLKEFDAWNNGIVWADLDNNCVYKQVHCILDREIYGDLSNEKNVRKKPYRLEVCTFNRVEFYCYECDE